MGPRLTKDFNLESSWMAKAQVQAMRAMINVSNLPHRLLPDLALRQLENANYNFGREALEVGLGDVPANWAFKAIA